MWPETRWPPSGSPAFKEGSRLTREPAASSPSVVRERVSRDTSAANVRSRNSTAVRQQPCTQMLSPILIPDGSSPSKAINSRVSPPRVSRLTTRPTSCTIPVNIYQPPRLSRHTNVATAAEASLRTQAQPHVITDLMGIYNRKPGCLLQTLQLAQLGQRPRLRPEELGGDIDDQLVDELLSHHRSGEARA